jgi:hydroxymethylpyrimidine pyrophosphatase-like HAD family hydrolase
MARIRLVAFDLDGTLLNGRLQVSPANRQALAAAGRQG